MDGKNFADDDFLDYYLTVPDELENSSTYEKLEKIFKKSRGGCDVYLMKNCDMKKFIKKVSYDEKICEQLKNLLGEKNVEIW